MAYIVDSIISWVFVTVGVYGSIILIAVKAASEKEARRREDMEFWAERR